MEQNEMPIGFFMALAMNPEALQIFATLGEDEKEKVLAGTHSIQSREEMRRYVDALVKNKQ